MPCIRDSKGYRFPKLVISHAIYLYHRLLTSYWGVQELLFKRGIDVSHETVRAWCVRFGPDLAEALRQHKPKQGCVWHLGEMRAALSSCLDRPRKPTKTSVEAHVPQTDSSALPVRMSSYRNEEPVTRQNPADLTGTLVGALYNSGF